jgi:hypothetical protein
MRRSVGITIAAAMLAIGAMSAQSEGGKATDGPVVAPSLVGDPSVLLYRFTGLVDTAGDPNTGSVTVFQCTSFSPAAESLRVQIRNFQGMVVADESVTLPGNQTWTIVTRDQAAYFSLTNYTSLNLQSGEMLDQGSARIWATTTRILCTAQVIRASAELFNGLQVHGIRFNPLPDSQQYGPVLAPRLAGDPQVLLYRYTGIRNLVVTNGGVATAFHCTNFSGLPEELRIQVRGSDGTVVKDVTDSLNHNQTFTFATGLANAFYVDSNLALADLAGGSARMWATTTQIICVAQVVGAFQSTPFGQELPGIRFNAIPGTQVQ